MKEDICPFCNKFKFIRDMPMLEVNRHLVQCLKEYVDRVLERRK